MNTCINCGNEFNAERTTAKFCSDKCRIYHNRKKLSVTKEPLSVTKCNANSLSVTDSKLTGTKHVIPKHSKAWQQYIDGAETNKDPQYKKTALSIIANFEKNAEKYHDTVGDNMQQSDKKKAG